MYKDPYILPKLKTELSLPKVLVIIITILFTLVIPAELITYYNRTSTNSSSETSKNTNSQNSSVAGVTTEKSSQNIDIPFLNTSINLNSQSGVFILAGSILIGVSLILLMFLVVDNTRVKRRK